jgi:hypothetical protein
MALGILEPAHTEHVPGTVDVWQAAQRDAELLESARHLKKTKDGRRILVPQPTDDPNDPLVGPFKIPELADLTSAELATLETRPRPWYPVLCICHSDSSIASPCSRLNNPGYFVRKDISRCGRADCVPSGWRRCRRRYIRSFSSHLGQEAPVPVRSTLDDRIVCMGRRNTENLQLHLHSVGAHLPRRGSRAL